MSAPLRYLVEATWAGDLRWLAAEDSAVRNLRDRLARGRPSLADRVALGKLVETALAERSPAVATRIAAAIAGVAERVGPAPMNDGGIVSLALQVSRDREAEFDRAVEQLNTALLGHVDFRVQGPA